MLVNSFTPAAWNEIYLVSGSNMIGWNLHHLAYWPIGMHHKLKTAETRYISFQLFLSPPVSFVSVKNRQKIKREWWNWVIGRVTVLCFSNWHKNFDPTATNHFWPISWQHSSKIWLVASNEIYLVWEIAGVKELISVCRWAWMGIAFRSWYRFG